jgi:hydrogenase assembly chaperone HypC/HupF
VTGPGIVCDHTRGCITCGDEAVPVRVVMVDEAQALATCEDEAGQRTVVEIGLVDPVRDGDLLLVHAGAALARLEEDAR